MLDIVSAQNQKIKYVKSLLQKKNRKSERAYIIEGTKTVRDAFSAGHEIIGVYVSESYSGNCNFDAPAYRVADDIFAKISDTVNPQGILAAVRMPDERFVPVENGAYIYCDAVRDPGNLGTLVRTADSAGFDGVLLSEDCVDLYNPKTVRACMGSLFHIQTAENFTHEKLREMKNGGFGIYAGALREDTIDYRRPDYTKGSVIVVGNEANGVSDELLSFSTAVKIPIVGKAESLNAAIAGAVMMYELRNQRNPLD